MAVRLGFYKSSAQTSACYSSTESWSVSAAPSNAALPADPASAESRYREIRYEHTHSFPALLDQLGVSLLISTYQAGKLVVVGVDQGQVVLSCHNFERAMGLAVRPDRIAVGTQAQVWFLRGAPDLVPRLEPPGRHDGCYLARSAHFTGDVQAHELAWVGDELWLVNTLFSCLATLHEAYSFVPRWRPPFITELAAEDRCHLNGLAVVDGRPKYVTCLAQTNTPHGWRPVKATGGCVLDVASGAVVVSDLAMPHSPRVYEERLWLLHSGRGQLALVNPAAGKVDPVVELPGYTRGLAFAGPYAFVGLSRIRETSTFGGMPIEQRKQELRCGVAAIDLRSGRQVGYLEFCSGVEEIFDVQVLAGMRWPVLSGPHATLDASQTIWVVPQPRPENASGSNRFWSAT